MGVPRPLERGRGVRIERIAEIDATNLRAEDVAQRLDLETLGR
jgi:hypothetical protein